MSLTPILQYNQMSFRDFAANIYGAGFAVVFFERLLILCDCDSNAMRL